MTAPSSQTKGCSAWGHRVRTKRVDTSRSVLSWVQLAMTTVIACGLPGSAGLAQSLPAGRQSEVKRGAPILVGLGPAVELTLRDAIDRALTDNLEIRVERDELQVGDLRIQETRGAYDPQVGFSVGRDSSATPTTSVLQAGDIASERASSQTFAPTLSQLLPTGGSITANFSNARASTNNAFLFVNPLYSSGLTIGFEQPLLRGLFNNPVRRELRVRNLDSHITETQFRQTVSEIVQRVEEQYWSLVYATEAHRVRQESRELAVKQRDQISQKVQAGLLTPVALTAANAEVAVRDQDVLQAEVLIVAAQNGLKRLLAGDPTAPIWSGRLAPLDRPQIGDPPATLTEALQQALDRRPELERLDLQAQQQQVDREYVAWETKPQVNVSGNFGSIGRSGQVFRPVFDREGGLSPIGREPDPSHPAFGAYREAWNQVFGYSFPHWTVRLDVQMPIFNRTAHAQLAQVDVTRRQLQSQVKSQQQAIMVEVANAYETVMLQRRVLDVARVARELSQEQVTGEMARFEVGFTTNFEVLRYQRDLGEAQVRELRAIIDYQIALAALRKATGVNLDEHDLVLAKSPR
jgi:outer membrane protein TolC